MKWPKQNILTVKPKGEPDYGKDLIISSSVALEENQRLITVHRKPLT